jgi:hypothetical protein
VSILNSPAAFEEFCGQISERLASDRQARLEFLTYAIERLSGLKDSAEKLANAEVAASVDGHLATAKEEMAALQSLAADPW